MESGKLETGRVQGKGVVAKLESYDERDVAATLLNTDIAIQREQLPPAEEGAYYWMDLIGLKVCNTEGDCFGTVAEMMPTGANDVLVVRDDEGQEVLIPYVAEVYILDVDLEQGVIMVDWTVE